MNNIVDLFSDIIIKKNDITGFSGNCDNDKKEVLDKIRNKMSQRKVDSEKEEIEKLKNKFMYEKKIEDLTSSIFSSLLESFSDVRHNVRHTYGNCTSDIWHLRDKYPKAKVVGIMFSGGLDSTTLLLRELNKGNIVIPILNRFNSNDDTCSLFKYMMAQIALTKIAEKISKIGNKMILVSPIVCNHIQFGCLGHGFVYTQQMFNSVAPVCIGYERIRSIDEIMLGTVMGDQGVSYINDMRRIYNDAMKFQVKTLEGNASYVVGRENKIAKLTFPLIKSDKVSIKEEFVYLCESVFRFDDMELPVFSCENLDINNKIIFKNNKIFLKTCTVPCKVTNDRFRICHSCEFDYLDNIDSYTIYFRICREEFLRVAKDMLDERYFNIVKKNFDKYIKIDKESDKCLEIKNKHGTKKVRCFTIPDEDITAEVDDKPIEIIDFNPEKSDGLIKNRKRDLEKIKKIVNEEDRDEII